jgi:hypothetical protein
MSIARPTMRNLENISRGCRKRLFTSTLLLLALVSTITAKNPKDDFCRRFGHQTTVIDDKLYIDGGYFNHADFPQDSTNYSSKLGEQADHRQRIGSQG